MKNNFKIIILAIVIIIIGLFVYNLVNKKVSVTPDNTPVVKVDSLIGCYVVHLEKDIYTLDIQSEKDGVVSGILAYNNFEKDSSSGSFTGTFKDNILLGQYSFDSEGMRSESQVIFKKVGESLVQGFGPVKVIGSEQTFDPLSAVVYEAKSTFVKSSNCLEKFTDPNNVLTFEYNPIFPQLAGDGNLSLDWRINTKDKGTLLSIVIIPRTYMPNTNFSDAKLTLGRSSAANSIKSCISTPTNGEVKGAVVIIGGYPFTKFTLSDAGAGNFYETTSYRGIVAGDCYAIEYTIHSTNIGNYSPDQNIKVFDKSLIQGNLEKVIQSLKFLVN